MLNQFSNSTLAVLTKDSKNKFYVYCLVDPRDHLPFYIGKGTENRVFEHQKMAETLQVSDDEQKNLKLNKINAILRSGYQVESYIISYGLSEKEAYASENTLINYVKLVQGHPLTNMVKGHGTIGMSVEELEKRFGYQSIEEADIQTNELILAVKITDGFSLSLDESLEYGINRRDDKNLKSRTLGEWIVGENRLPKIKYIIGVNTGASNAVISAYKVSSKQVESKKGKKGCYRYSFTALSTSQETLEELGLYKRSLPNLSFGRGSTAYLNK